ALGRPIPHLALVAHVTDPRGATRADATLDGSVDRKPARGSIALARHGLAWDLSTLDVAIGSVALQGAGRIDARRLVDGRLRLAAGNLDDLSPLALTRLAGTLSLDAAFATPDAKQNATLTARADNLAAGPAAIHALSLRAAASDLYGKPVVDADAKLDRATVAGQTISTASLTAKGAAARSAIAMSARAAGFDLDAAGALVPGLAKGAATRFELASFSARRDAHRIALAGPASLTLADGGVAIDRLALGISGGRVAVSGRAGKLLDLTAEAKGIPLAAADIAAPGLGLSGTLDADARVTGTPTDPTGPYHVTIKHLVAPQARDAGLPPIDVAASGKLGGHRASLDARIAAGRAGTLQALGSLPLDAAGLLDLAVHGKLDAAVANAKLAADGRTLSGSVLVDARLAGTRAAPRVSGNAVMSGGTFRDALHGVRLDGIEARVAAKGDHVSIERLAAATPNGGRLSGSGEVRIDPAAGFPGTVRLQGRDAQLAASSLMTATANLDLAVSGPLARAPRVAGRVDLVRARVGVPDRLPTTLTPLPGVTHVNPSPELAAKLAAARRKDRLASKGRKSRPALFEAALDVTVAADNGIFVRGRGIDAELGGKLHVTGSTGKPVPQGGFALTHGTIAALGKTLSFSKGEVTFSGDLMPEVDFVAQISAPDITAQVQVTGPATAPAFKFSSSPELPQDEILARVMFQKPSGSLSGFQALQLAQAAAQFSGDGDSAYQKMLSSLGVVPSASGDDGPMSKISRALGDRVSVGVVTGATADQTGLSADVAVSKHLRVQSDVRSNGATSVGVGSEIEY
ncbi:MAG: translocation/assembly module TamB domain-containing protein, partial [Beijerinckiaceae bacterium]|nr:translocation/assembly module TamB domain-containing protein [Beijerinckiaceae bacterium]